MKRALGILLAIGGFNAYAQDFQFDYLLEYEDGDGEVKNYYINSKNSAYILSDSNYKLIVNENFIVYYAAPYIGKPYIYDVLPDQVENNTFQVQELGGDKSEVVVNGFKCRKYIYKAQLTDDEDKSIKHPITYEYFITDNAVNSIAPLNRNEMLLPESMKFNNFPKGTVVKVQNINDDYYKAFVQLNLKKIIKLDKTLVLDLTNDQITNYLLKNQAE
jgi:hypothetical protein